LAKIDGDRIYYNKTDEAVPIREEFGGTP